MPVTEAPTADELLADPVVRRALAEARADSSPGDPVRRHEEGGWIYMDVTSGTVTTTRASGGDQDSIDLSERPP